MSDVPAEDVTSDGGAAKEIERLQKELEEAKELLAEAEKLKEQLKDNDSALETPDGRGIDLRTTGQELLEAQRIFKVIMVGDSGVGKTTFVRHLCSGSYPGDVPTTVGVHFYTKSLRVDGELFSLKIWDTAGSEKFRSMTRSYFRDANGVLLLYDVANEATFTNVRRWMGDILECAAESVVILLVGNKIDLQPDIHSGVRVSPEHGRTLAASYQAEFAEVSAHSGAGVIDACKLLCRSLKKKEDEMIRHARTSIDLEEQSHYRKSVSCLC